MFLIKAVNNTIPWTSVINDFNGEETTEKFYGKSCKKHINAKVNKKKEGMLFIILKGCDNSCNSWTDESDI